jgi:hypothetical protein
MKRTRPKEPSECRRGCWVPEIAGVRAGRAARATANGIYDPLLKRQSNASGISSGSSDLLKFKLFDCIAPLAKASARLPGEVIRYIAQGDNTSVIVTLQQGKASAIWRKQIRSRPDSDGLPSPREALSLRWS